MPRLESGESILVQAGGSGIGTAAIKMAKAIGATVFTTVGDDEKVEKGARALGADHVINYRSDRFESIVRKLTGKKGRRCRVRACRPDTFNGSLAVLEARRTARHLRLDLGAIDADQPVPALPAAVSHLRLVRLHDPQRA
jgi:NADPH:quinone reductase-like Zn-dependent oxidoreductase